MKKVFFLTLITLLLLTGGAYGKMFNQPGMELSIGGFSMEALGAHDGSYDFYWARLGLFNRHNINDNWDVNGLIHLGYMWWAPKESHNTNVDAFNIGAEIILYRKVYKKLSLGGGLGLSTITPREGLPEVGNRGVYGTTTVRARWEMDEDYGIVLASDHISATCYDDPGKNVLSFKIYFMF
jgi:hypothetical protein